MRRIHIWLIPLVLTLAVSPALAYTIHLKDGTKIIAKVKYEIDGERAIITLPSGTRTAYPLAEIDVAKTDEANQQNIGTAIVIEDGQAQDLTRAAPAEPKENLQDLIRNKGASVQAPPPPQPTREPTRTRDRRPTRPASERRSPPSDPQLANELKAYLISRGAPADLYQGSTGRRLLVVFETRSEGLVFKALAASAYALGHVRASYPDRIDAFEIFCEVPDEGGLGGRFTMTAEQAEALLAGRIDIPAYFVDNVEF